MIRNLEMIILAKQVQIYFLNNIIVAGGVLDKACFFFAEIAVNPSLWYTIKYFNPVCIYWDNPRATNCEI